METKKDIYHLWVQFTTKNDEQYFWQFIKGFVEIWEPQLALSWKTFPNWKTAKHDLGPHLSRLPDELLPAIGKFIIVVKEQMEKKKCTSDLFTKLDLLMRCLVVICRNFDNIAFIASCNFVSLMVGICATFIHWILKGNMDSTSVNISFLQHFCHLLESMYDPYFTWRHFLQGGSVSFDKLSFQPAFLHVEVVPFIYDCFQTPLIEHFPVVSTELLHVLGAVISGAQSMILKSISLNVHEQRDGPNSAQCLNEGHNALRAICPATVNIVMSVISHSGASVDVRRTAVQCFVMMVQVLNKSAPDQRQIEIGTIIQLYHDSLTELVGGECSPVMLSEVVSALRILLTSSSAQYREQIQQSMVDNHVLDMIIFVLEESSRFELEKQRLASDCVRTLASILVGSSLGKERMIKTDAYNRLFLALQTLGPPCRELLVSLLHMVTENETDECHTLQNAEAMLPIIRWLPEVDNANQLWLVMYMYQICTVNLASKALACQKGTIPVVCETLNYHKKLTQKAASELLKLLEVLSSHSVTPYELKQILLLLREDETEKFPYRMQLLHVISSVARKSDYHCHSYFDIQKDTDGISVPEIKKWPGASYGFTFHCWIRLDIIETPVVTTLSANYRRLLFNLLTGGGTGLEAFFRPDGTLVVGIYTKKECLAASVSDYPLLDGQWHCINISYMSARRPFGQNQVAVYIDGVQRMGASVKSQAMTDQFTSCTVGSTPPKMYQYSQSSVDGGKSNSNITSLIPGMSGIDRGILPSFMNQVPNYFTLPIRSTTPLDPNVKSFPVGMQDSVWGSPTCLKGQVGLVSLFNESLSHQQVKTLYEGGPNCHILFALDEVPDYMELSSRLVFCFSPEASWNDICLDLAPANKYDGHVVANLCHTLDIKTSINGIGGVHALFPILENACMSDGEPDLSFLSPSVEKECLLVEGGEGSVDPEEWEILPSSSYSDWKLEQNPVSGFLSLLKNIIMNSSLNQEELLKNNGLAIIGVLLSKAKPQLIDVNVLMAVQLLIEVSRDIPNLPLLRSLYQHILFNFKIWSQSQFHIRIGHIQYISTVIKDDRKFFRKKYGVQFLLDVIRLYYTSCDLLSVEDCKTIRVSLLGLVKYYLQKDVNVKEISALLGFICSVKEEELVIEVLEMMISFMEIKNCKDQMFLLLFEQHSSELLYCHIINKNISMELKQKILKLFSVLLRTDRVYERHKTRLKLQDTSVLGPTTIGMYPGLVSLIQDQKLSMEVTAMLLDQMLLTDCAGGYAGALSLLHILSTADLDLKLEAARKILTTTFMKPSAAQQFTKQIGWQDCVTRLLVKRPISTADVETMEMLPDLMSFDEDSAETDVPELSPLSVSRISAHVTDAATVIENEILEVAETVTHAVADNIYYAADNISSAVVSAYSAFRQKTVEVQESLEGLGESAVSRLKKRRSLASLHETTSEREGSPTPSQSSPHSVRAPQLTQSVGLDLDSLSLDNRSQSSSSTDDLSTPSYTERSFSCSTKDDISISSTQSIPASNAETNETEDEDKIISEALRQWKEVDEEKLVDQEEELCYLVVNILFTLLWRGVEGASKEAWKERGQVMACINLLGLNNELYCSHLKIKLKILEMGVQASLSDLRDVGQSLTLSAHSENAAQLLRWIYDLVVLDPNEDMSKKVSTKLLEGVMNLLDALLVFQEGPGDEWTEMARVAFGILLSCAGYDNLEICAIATAKLHALIRTRTVNDPEEMSYIIYKLNMVVQHTIEVNNQEHYRFLTPVVKGILEKLNQTFGLVAYLPQLPRSKAGPVFIDDFHVYCQTSEWKNFIEKKIKPLHDTYQGELSSQLSEPMNTFWAECYESSKTAIHRRNREVGDSKLRFQAQIFTPFRTRQHEEGARFQNLQSHRHHHELVAKRKWKLLKEFYVGPRGAWQSRTIMFKCISSSRAPQVIVRKELVYLSSSGPRRRRSSSLGYITQVGGEILLYISSHETLHLLDSYEDHLQRRIQLSRRYFFTVNSYLFSITSTR